MYLIKIHDFFNLFSLSHIKHKIGETNYDSMHCGVCCIINFQTIKVYLQQMKIKCNMACKIAKNASCE
jgi:hypothetical protein